MISLSTAKKKQLSLADSIEFIPLIYGFKQNLLQHNLQIEYTDSLAASHKLREGISELALIPAMEYACKKETWRIVPDICLASRGPARFVQLFFKKGLQSIRKVAIDMQAKSAAPLLQILMREKFVMSPEYISTTVNPTDIFARSDAVLLSGHKALSQYRQNRNRLDLGEEWTDMTDLPCVYAFWSGRELTVNKSDIQLIKKSFELGQRNLQKISKSLEDILSEKWIFFHDMFTRNLQYSFDEEAQQGLKEMYNYAFFFGLIEFIPDLFFFESG